MHDNKAWWHLQGFCSQWTALSNLQKPAEIGRATLAPANSPKSSWSVQVVEEMHSLQQTLEMSIYGWAREV